MSLCWRSTFPGRPTIDAKIAHTGYSQEPCCSITFEREKIFSSRNLLLLMQNCRISFDFTCYREPKFSSYDHPLGSLSPLLSNDQGRSQDFSKGGSQRLLIYGLYRCSPSCISGLSHIIAAWRPILTKDKSRWRKYFTKKQILKKVGFSTMAFTANILSWRFLHLNIVGCLLKRRPTKGVGGVHWHPRTPPPPPSYAPGFASLYGRRENRVKCKVTLSFSLNTVVIC